MFNHTRKKGKVFKLIFLILCLAITLFLSSKSVRGASLKSINDINSDAYIDLTNQQGLVLYSQSSSGIKVSSSNGNLYDYNQRRPKWTGNLVVF